MPDKTTYKSKEEQNLGIDVTLMIMTANRLNLIEVCDANLTHVNLC